ncbi:hypothetical protein CR201_G0008731 [Pongo abelii]|uniref:Uncharacterized protein n=1 Tax=Pongo abelii TaxID=9601 RepID=A0A2J8WQC4_PONAB|nr:hypothetical protein CR201_G0008731 [Pongo abelii]
MEIISSTSREGKHITNIYSHQCTKFYCNLLTSLEMLRLGSKSTDMKSISCQDIVEVSKIEEGGREGYGSHRLEVAPRAWNKHLP